MLEGMLLKLLKRIYLERLWGWIGDTRSGAIRDKVLQQGSGNGNIEKKVSKRNIAG